jgi:NADH-quinone oxidoreductase subunit A
MHEAALHVESVWPIAIYFIAVLLLVSGMMIMSYILGQRHSERATGQPYESGIAPTGEARLRFDVKFYLVAMIFVIFDLETVFIFAWSAAIRDLGWAGYVEILVFIGVLFVALVYLWRMGVLDWGVRKKGERIRHE